MTTLKSDDPNATGDPLGIRDALLEALAQRELDTMADIEPIPTEFRQAAFRLAVALGRCGLFGVDPGEYNGVLPHRFAQAASEECALQLRRWVTKCEQLGRQWDVTEDSVDGDVLCCSFLLARMDFWAGYLAIDDSYQLSLRTSDAAAHELRATLQQVQACLATFDASLRANTDLLSVAAETELLANWREMLAEPYSLDLPWWLDGTLETALEQLIELSRACQPRPQIVKQTLARNEDVEGLRLRSAGKGTSAEDMPMVLAAGPNQVIDPLLDQLASYSVQELPTADYRRAWAHFLAATYRGTSERDDWREEFLRLARVVEPLDDEWRERVRRVEQLCSKDRHRARRLEGKGAFALEPRPISNQDDFVQLLHELTATTGASSR